MHWGMICLLLVTALQPAEPPKDEPAKKIPVELQGTWKLESLEIGGEPFPGLDKLQPKWIIKGDKILYGGEQLGVLSADATTAPRIFDLALGKAKTSFEGIYAVETSPYLTELQARISFSITAFTFIVVGIPLAIQTQRRETSFGIVITFLIVLLYYVLGAVGRGLKAHAGLYPELIIWTPNILFQVIGFWLFYRANHRK